MRQRCHSAGRACLWAAALLGGILTIGRAGASTVDAALTQLAGRLELLATRPRIAGLAVVAVDADGVLYQQTWGRRRVGAPDERIGPATRFRIASLTKGFSSTVAGMLVAEGELAWSDRVARAIDYFTLPQPAHPEKATVEHLLSHRTGLPPNAYDNLLEANWPPDQIVRRYGQVEPLCEVGTCYGYQNVTFNLIDEIVEAHTDEAFEQAVEARIFRPLEMRHAGFGARHLTADEDFARPHLKIRGDRLAERSVRVHYYRVPAAAGINLSVSDLAIWLRAQLGAFPDVISPKLLAELREPRVLTRHELRAGWRRQRVTEAWYGLGWRVYDYAGRRIVYHAGAVEGYRAQLAVFPNEGVAIAALWNSNASLPWGIVPEFADALFGLPAEDWMKLDRSGASASTAPP